MVAAWIAELRQEHLFGYNDPVFPKTLIGLGPDNKFRAVGLSREFWKDAGRIRSVFKEAFTRAGLPYFNPHAFRKTLTQLGQKTCGTIEAMKAWSQNLGHDGVITTFTSYGTLSRGQQENIMRSLCKVSPPA